MRLCQSLTSTLLILVLGLSSAVRADLWWDSNSNSAGGSNSDTAPGTWGTDNFWSTDMDGNAVTGAWVADETAVFSASTNVTGTYGVTVSGTQSASGIRFEEGTLTLNSGTVTLTNAAEINTADGLTATINSTLSGAAGLTKSGGGALVLSGAGNNYSGNTMLANNPNLGTFNILRLGGSEVIPDDSLFQMLGQNSIFDLNGMTETVRSIATVGAGAGAFANSRIDIGTGNLIIDDDPGQVETYQSQIFSSSTGKITKNGSGQFNLDVTNSSWDGELVLNDGLFGIGLNNSLGTNSSSTARLTFNGGTITNYKGNAISLQTQNVDITNSFSALVTNSNLQLLGTGAAGIGSVAITLKVNNPTITVDNTAGDAGTFIFNGPVGDEGQNRGFTKAGPGQLTLAHPTNTFTGAVTILEGRLAVNANGGVGNGTGAINFSGGNFSVSQANRTLAIANPLNINAANSTILATANAANPVLEFSSSTIGGAGSLRIAHEGTACGTPFQGNMCIFDATLSGTSLNLSMAVEIDTGATYLNGNTSVARLNSGNTSGAQTYAGVISGDGIFRRSAAGGTTTLTAANTYSGGTEVEGGTLTVSGSTATLGTGDVTVTGGTLSIASGVANAIANAATLSISGTGIVNLGTGINDTIAGLFLGGAMQGSGTYGSSSSSATNQLDQYFSGMGILTLAVTSLAGDYNSDGKVDAADYVLWRKDPASFGGDPGGYNTWVANFGNMLGSGSASALTNAVPEPTSLALLMVAVGPAVAGFFRRSRPRRRTHAVWNG